MKGMWVGYDVGCTMGLTCGHGAWQIDRQSSGSMWNSYSFQPVGQWMSYSFTDLGAEGCCRSLNALFWLCLAETEAWIPQQPTGLQTNLSKSGCVSAFLLCPYDSTVEWSACLSNDCYNPPILPETGDVQLVWTGHIIDTHNRVLFLTCTLHLCFYVLYLFLTFFYLWHLSAHLAQVISHLWAFRCSITLEDFKKRVW